MILKIIETEKQYGELLEWVDTQFDLNLSLESNEGQKPQTALAFIKQYEDEHYPCIQSKITLNLTK